MVNYNIFDDELNCNDPYIESYLLDDRLRYLQLMDSSEWLFAALSKEMTEELLQYLKKNNLIGIFDCKNTMVCLNCKNYFIQNGKLCSCYDAISTYHNYICAISYKCLLDMDEVITNVKNIVKSKKRAFVRKKLEAEADGCYDKNDLSMIYKLQAGLCYYCMSPIYSSQPNKYTIDHIIPLSYEGSNWPINLALTCKSCNLKKSWKTERKFINLIRSDKRDDWVADHKEFISFIKRQKRKLFLTKES